MRRSGRTNNDAVPAFFTRSRAKNFIGVNSSDTPNHDAIKQQQHEEEEPIKIEEPENKSNMVKSEEKVTDTTLQQKALQGDQAQQQQKNETSGNATIICSSSPFALGENKSSTQTEPDDQEMKVEEIKQVNVVKAENMEQTATSQEGNQYKNVSATTKALQQMEQLMDNRRDWRKKQKLPLCVRRRKLNQRLNKILKPKSGLMFLHELKPGCTFKIQEQAGSNTTVFLAQVEYNDKVIAVGQGLTKPCAKNVAAENAIKVLVAEALSQQALRREKTEVDEIQPCDNSTDVAMETSEDLSLAGLASFAMYKMLTEWQNQGTDLPLISFQQKKKSIASKSQTPKKELPANADKLHPSFLLNTMRPGIVSVELERSAKDNLSSVTMGYEIGGKIYKGSGPNKKEARKRAAMAALSDLYGLNYDY